MVEPAQAGDRYGDVFVDTAKSMEVYREWLARTRRAPGPGGLRRPLWLDRPLRPAPTRRSAFRRRKRRARGGHQAGCGGAPVGRWSRRGGDATSDPPPGGKALDAGVPDPRRPPHRPRRRGRRPPGVRPLVLRFRLRNAEHLGRRPQRAVQPQRPAQAAGPRGRRAWASHSR